MTRREKRTRLAGVLGGAGALAVLALLFPAAARAQGAAERLLTLTAGLEKTLATLKLSDDEARQLSEELRDVGEHARAGRWRLALYRLQQPWAMTAARAYLASKSEVKGVEAFEAEWKRLGGEMDERERRLASVPAADSELFVRALAEAAIQQARPYYQSGRLYGLNTTPADGLFYAGLAPAQLDFALFSHGLGLGPRGAAPRLRSLEPELTRLEAETLEAYRRAEAAAGQANQQQPLFNGVNSTLKLAGELNRAGRHAGALHKYLDALLTLGRATAAPPAEGELPRLRARAADYEKRLRTAQADHSLGLLYLESAQAALAGRPDAESLTRAAVIFERVLPAYFDFCCGGK
ncbi:MAG TPA: hypothetical protein VG148_07095 [Pyrinomonadaceae bacterium]|nr:hypothetical protein [Pyrinomonadaceae bacterium]